MAGRSQKQIIMEEVDDLDQEPGEDEVHEYAEMLGLDPETEQELMWIAKAGITAPLPEDWKPVQMDDGELYFYNFKTNQSSWEHPSDEKYRQMVAEERKKLQLRHTLGMGERKPKSPTPPTSGPSIPLPKELPPSRPASAKLAPLLPNARPGAKLNPIGDVAPARKKPAPIGLSLAGNPSPASAASQRPKTAHGAKNPATERALPPDKQEMQVKGGGSRFLKGSSPAAPAQPARSKAQILSFSPRSPTKFDHNGSDGSSGNESSLLNNSQHIGGAHIILDASELEDGDDESVGNKSQLSNPFPRPQMPSAKARRNQPDLPTETVAAAKEQNVKTEKLVADLERENERLVEEAKRRLQQEREDRERNLRQEMETELAALKEQLDEEKRSWKEKMESERKLLKAEMQKVKNYKDGQLEDEKRRLEKENEEALVVMEKEFETRRRHNEEQWTLTAKTEDRQALEQAEKEFDSEKAKLDKELISLKNECENEKQLVQAKLQKLQDDFASQRSELEKKHLDDLEMLKKEYEERKESAKQKYEGELNEMNADFEEMLAKNRAEWKMKSAREEADGRTQQESVPDLQKQMRNLEEMMEAMNSRLVDALDRPIGASTPKLPPESFFSEAVQVDPESKNGNPREAVIEKAKQLILEKQKREEIVPRSASESLSDPLVLGAFSPVPNAVSMGEMLSTMQRDLQTLSSHVASRSARRSTSLNLRSMDQFDSIIDERWEEFNRTGRFPERLRRERALSGGGFNWTEDLLQLKQWLRDFEKKLQS